MNRGDKSLNSNYKNFVKAKAIEAENKKRLLKINPRLDNKSGIYFLTRIDENGIQYFYIGQAVHIILRMCSHLTGYQHIDLSIKKRGFFSKDNPHGWAISFLHYPADKLDEMEQFWILEYTKKGYQCRYNKTSGSQGEGKEKINEFKPAKGYRDGIQQGKKTLARELSHIIDTHLQVSLKPEKQGNKVSIRAFEKFQNLIDEKTYEKES